MSKRWTLNTDYDENVVNSLIEELKINPVLCKLLAQRGITNYDAARDFFRPSLDHLHDPFLMKDMDVAVDRINKAILNKERILVYGDYDVDGTTAVSVVYLFLKSLFDNVDFYIPDRYHEGYGVSFKGVEYAHDNGFSLIIALDCGIKAHDKVAKANEYGIDFIICDHHRPSAELPAALAILDPKRLDCNYPYDELSGCGVGFKLIQGIAQHNNIPFSELEQYLDLVAVSIAADIVDMRGENRVLAYFGLKLINTNPRHGIKAIMELSKVTRELTISDIVFVIAPRINAAGRIESGNRAVELLISKDVDVAKFKGDEINDHNTYRKELDTDITEQALLQIENDETFLNRKSTVVYSDSWHKGVIGIVASRLTDKYYRPTVVMTQTNGHVAGSARSVKDFDVYNAIESCADLLDQFGGHMYAAGLTMKVENVNAFIEKFEEVVSATIEERMLTRELSIDAELDLKDVTDTFFKILKQFAPFGPGNMNPVFVTYNVCDSGYSRIVGNNHLKLSLMQADNKFTYDGIAFQMGILYTNIAKTNPHKKIKSSNLTAVQKRINEISRYQQTTVKKKLQKGNIQRAIIRKRRFELFKRYKLIVKKNQFHICYHLDENNYNNKTNLQLTIKDLKIVGN